MHNKPCLHSNDVAWQHNVEAQICFSCPTRYKYTCDDTFYERAFNTMMLRTHQKWPVISHNPTMFPWLPMDMGMRDGSTRALLTLSDNAIYNIELCKKTFRPRDVTTLETVVLIGLMCQLCNQIKVSFKMSLNRLSWIVFAEYSTIYSYRWN